MSRFQRLLRPRNALAATAVAATGAYAYNKSITVKAPPLPTPELKRDAKNHIIPPSFPAAKSRADQLADLRRSPSDGEEYDLLVIGGGATGTGIALDAVTRGLKVALVERDDFSAGTSSKSTKLVHGGVRYLEKAVWNLDYSQLQLVMEALRERKSFLTIAPHLSAALPILIPLAQWWQAPYMWIGTKMYDLLAGSQQLEGSYYMSRAKSLEACPRLNGDKIVGSLVYYDGQHNDSRMNVGLAMTAALYGGTVLNHVEVTSLEKGADGKIRGAKVRDTLAPGSEEFAVSAKGVINATGPFADAIEHMDDPERKSIVAPASGVHVMLPKDICPNGMGVLDAATSDGRVIFILPWQGFTLAGTTDNACDVEENPIPRQSDVDFILKEANKLLNPDSLLTHEDVLASWSGIRPLVKDPNAKNTESLVRSHLVRVSPSGLLTCAGGKWTTFRQMSEEAVDEAISTFNLKPRGALDLGDISSGGIPGLTTTGACQTRFVRLAGSHGYTPALPSQLAEKYSDVDAEVLHHLATNYGDRAWAVLSDASPAATSRLVAQLPFVEAEVRYGVRAEAACTAIDVISRRMRLSFLDVNGALASLPRVVDIMADELKWDEKRRDAEFEETVHFLRSMGLGKGKMLQGETVRVDGVEVAHGAGRISPVEPQGAM